MTKFSWLKLTKNQLSSQFCIEHNSYAQANELPPHCQLSEKENRLFWSNCARASLAQYLQAITLNETAQASYFKCKFLTAMTNRRVSRHLRIVDERNYEPVRAFYLLARESLLSSDLSTQKTTYDPIVGPFNAWSEQITGRKIDLCACRHHLNEVLRNTYFSIIVGLEKGLLDMPPTRVAQLMTESLQSQGVKQFKDGNSHQETFQAIHSLQKFLTPYLLDTRYFKKKHRIDALLS